jgi:hypothetical protein
MHMPSRRRQASSPISKGEVEAARALGVVLFYPLEKHVNDPGLLEELLAYLSFHEFITLSSTSKRIRTRYSRTVRSCGRRCSSGFLPLLATHGGSFGLKEPLELTLKVCVRPPLREGCFLRQNFFPFILRRTSIPTSGASPSRSTDMLKSPRRRRRTSPPTGQRPGLSACSRPLRVRTAALSSACVRKPRRRQRRTLHLASRPRRLPKAGAPARSSDPFPPHARADATPLVEGHLPEPPVSSRPRAAPEGLCPKPRGTVVE